MGDEILESKQKIEEWVKTLSEVNERSGAFKKSLDVLTKATQTYTDDRKKDNKRLKDAFDVAMRQRADETSTLRRRMHDRVITEEEYTESVKKINDDFKNATKDATPYMQMLADATIKNEAAATSFSNFINNKFITGVSGAFNTVLGNLTAAYSSSNTGLQSALNNATFTFKTIASAATGLVSMIPGAGEILGPIVGAVGDAGVKIMEFMNKQVEAISSSFKEASNAGAIFADGVSGLKNAAFSAGLTTDLFSKSLNENRDAVILFGGSMTEGAKKIGNVSKFINPSQFQALGFGLEELPGLIANVGARMRRSGAATDEQVARATAAYAQNLRVIADLTGEDAKTLQAKADQDANDLAYQQYLATKTPEQRAAIENELKALPDASKEMFKEMVKSGGNVFTESSALLASQVPGFEKMARSLFNTAEQGSVQTGQGLDILSQFITETKGQVLSLRDLGLAGEMDGALKPVTEVLGKSLALLNKTPEDIEKLRQTLAQAAVTTDPTTQQLIDAEQIGMANQIEMQKSVMNSLGDYLTVVKTLNGVTGLLATGMEKLSRAVLGNGEQFDNFTKSIAQSAKEGKELSQKSGWFTASDLDNAHAKLLTMTEKQIETLAKINDTTKDKILKTAGFSNVESFNREKTANEEQENAVINSSAGMFADGGIVNGPTSGYQATLHGNEAIVPIPSGVTTDDLPDYLSKASMSNNNGTQEMMNQVVGAISAPASQQNDLMQTLINKVDDLISATKDVASHTERTAARVA